MRPSLFIKASRNEREHPAIVLWKGFAPFSCSEWISLTMPFGLQQLMNKLNTSSTSSLKQWREKKVFDGNWEAHPCNYIWSCLHVSLPRSLSCSLWFPALPGTFFLIHNLMFKLLLLFQRRDESGAQNQTSCLVYLEERDKCGSRLGRGMHISCASEGVHGVGKGGGGGGGGCLTGAAQLSLTLGTVKIPPQPWAARRAPLRSVHRDKKPPWRDAVGSQTCKVIQRCWTDGSTMCELVSYSDFWPWCSSLEEKHHTRTHMFVEKQCWTFLAEIDPTGV